MAPKKVKAKDKKGPTKGQPSIGPLVNEQEQYLQKEHAILTEHINSYMQRMEHFQEKNEFLNKEAKQIRENSKAYLDFLAKCTLRCQNATTTLNDQNCSDLAQVRKQKEQLISQYMDREKEVRCQLIELETKFSLMKKELKELQPVKELQLEQLTCIRELEKKLLAMKIQHSERMHKVKSRFIQQKTEYELESQEKVQALAKKAEKEAVSSLIQHTKQIKAENCQLRSELLNLIQRAQGLKAFMYQLHEQQEQLLREHQYSHDLAYRHHWLTQRGVPKGTTPWSSFRYSLSAKNSLHSFQASSFFPSLGEGPELPTNIKEAARSSSQARFTKTSVRVPLVHARKVSP
ncbi:hypothetical protein lerEdw1_020801 [Lerista edwardsae]|nr:hypothetical protein lerEdw1_020801 [Lerista edwardsae]